MTQSKIFKINELVDLRLIDGRTYIYVNNKEFLICARLLLNIPIDRIQEADGIKSIDEAAEVFKQSLWQNRIVEGPMARPSRFQNNTITPEEEFKGHCSNIQAFFENGLNTDILASNIAFPLLKKLVSLGYKPAMRAFKEEIIIRFNEGTFNSRLYLYKQHYLNYLNREERQTLKVYIPDLVKQENSMKLKRSKEIGKEIRKELRNNRHYICKNCNRGFKGEYFQLEGKKSKLCLTCFNILHNRPQISDEEREDLKEKEKEKERQWLKREFGENHKLFETLQVKLNEWKEMEMLWNAERQKEIKEERTYRTEYHSKLDEPNYLNSHPSWGQADPPPFLAHIAEWLAGKIALRKVGRKYKKTRKEKKF